MAYLALVDVFTLITFLWSGWALPQAASGGNQNGDAPPKVWNIIMYGVNSKEWNQIFHISGIRFGCSSEPDRCLAEADATAQSTGVSKIFMAFNADANPNPSTLESYAAQYSRLSQSNPRLYGIDLLYLDDNVPFCAR